ncbi:MAG: hypothetical protein LBV61_07625 [Burkholderiaceae bacterium]|jgi:hypothetical protein|nr:hypothetical protein [Burkholderiaceae bacterium]
MSLLTSVNIQFHTHDDGKNPGTLVYVFVKNRRSNALDAGGPSDLVSNWIEYTRYQDFLARNPAPNPLGGAPQNPYLAYGLALGAGALFDDPSSSPAFELTLRSTAIGADEILLPAVDIHILADGNARWIFDYTVALTFDDDRRKTFSFTSKNIILDRDNQNYSGIGIENPLTAALPVFPKTALHSMFKKAMLELTLREDNEDFDIDLLHVHPIHHGKMGAMKIPG